VEGFEAEHGIVSIDIREGVAVKIHGIPKDVTQAEADQITAIIMAHAKKDK
jgi:hypothetical protein